MSEWLVRDTSRGNERECSSRAEAEETKENLIEIGATPEQLEIVPPDKASDGGTEPKQPEVVETPTESQESTENANTAQYDLPESVPVDTDPLVWMPDEFTDTIEGTVAINRKGFEVICQHFGVAVTTEKQLSPFDTNHEYAEVKATAITQDGQEYTAYGTARSEGGDDVNNLLELADTRAYKRAASRATGVGMVAVEEIQNDL
jgi:hypothetical protein